MLNAKKKNEKEESKFLKKVVRGPFYFLAFLLLFVSTSLIFVSMFTSNWQRKNSVFNKQEFYTYGLWFICRHVKLTWIKNHEDIYCSTMDYSAFPWIHACQVFYTISAALNLLIFLFSICGICRDCGKNNLGMPSFLFWMVVVSSIGQIIGVSVYGGKGIQDYSEYTADYSIIIASVGLGINGFSSLFFLIEIYTFPKTTRRY